MNRQEVKEEFEQILEEVKGIDEVSGEKAVEVAVAILQETGKDRRAELLNGRFGSNGNSNQSATFKQKGLMRRLGIKYKDDITKKEASELIDTAMKSNNGEGGY